MFRKTKTFTQVYLNDPNINKTLDFTKETGFLTHGWNDDAYNQWMTAVSRDWVTYKDMNVCRVNWQRLSVYGYITTSLRNTRIIGRYISEFIYSLDSYGLKPENVTLVGHSLGAHIMGFVGERFFGRIKRIIGLDAAGPLFTFPIPMPFSFRLDPTDAIQVICIHSGDGLTGISIPAGHQDFYGNSGVAPQLGCYWPVFYPTYGYDPIRCSHNRAIDFFQSSLRPGNRCTAIQCDNRIAYLFRKCANVFNRVGLDANVE